MLSTNSWRKMELEKIRQEIEDYFSILPFLFEIDRENLSRALRCLEEVLCGSSTCEIKSELIHVRLLIPIYVWGLI
jgi:hypothetical protein